MVKLNLLFKAELVNIDQIQPNSNDFTWFFKVECTSCHEVNPKWVGITKNEEIELSNSRGSANLVIKCKFCKRESSCSYDTSQKIQPYSMENNNQYQIITTLECRGLEIVAWQPRDDFIAFGVESNIKFEDIDLTDGEWADYDEKANQEVSIMGIETKIEKA
ncbi:DUF866-domain-containing protein [Neoconidiobolus thromboides FSU 785]|nr:DUF866-domain-containing protein [Neoconidiobolus thromboides FSU 785]